MLDSPAIGSSWSMSGWLLFSFLRRVSQVADDQLQQRVAGELTSTFVANYTGVIASGKDSSPY
jgi:hypothetical protein